MALLMATARFSAPLKPLMAATVTVVLPVVFGLMGTVFGARLMAKSGVSVGGTTLTVIFRVWVMAPLVPVMVSGYLPAVAPAGTLMVRVAVVGVAMLGASVYGEGWSDVLPYLLVVAAWCVVIAGVGMVVLRRKVVAL